MKKICKIHGKVDITKYNRCKKCSYQAVLRSRYKVRKSLIDILGGKCFNCGYDKCIASLEFHHLDRKKKSFSFGSKGYISLKKGLKEIRKCILLCANCHREEEQNKYLLKRKTSNKSSISSSRTRRTRKLYFVKLFDNKCSKCYYDKYVGALDFHHKESSKKSFGISSSCYGINNPKILKELKKCELLCANCHREKEYSQFNLDYLKYYRPKSLKIVSNCLICNKEILNRTYCSLKCFGISNRKAKRPNKKVLLKQIKDLGYVKTSKIYGVSDNAIRKWALS